MIAIIWLQEVTEIWRIPSCLTVQVIKRLTVQSEQESRTDQGMVRETGVEALTACAQGIIGQGGVTRMIRTETDSVVKAETRIE